MMHPTDEALLRYRFETCEGAEATEVAEHLRTCSGCAQRFAALGRAVDTLASYEVERELDPAAVARAVAAGKAKPREDAKAAAVDPEPGFLAWLGFKAGARFSQARLAGSLSLLAVMLLLAVGETVVAFREVETVTRISGETELLPGSRAQLRVEVLRPVSGAGVEGAEVTGTLLLESRRLPLFAGTTDANGVLHGAFEVPDAELGAAVLEVETSARGEHDVVRQSVTVAHAFKLHLSTDKPLYQPGQTIHVRALALTTPTLKPAVESSVGFELHDPKGNRLSAQTLKASRFGIASWNVELASELPLGDYVLSAQVGAQRVAVPLKVARYTLPKFKLELRTKQDTVLAGETLRAELSARYFFGKPVANGAVRAVLLRGDGALVAKEFNGVTDRDGQLRLQFEVPSTIASPGKSEVLTLQAEVNDAAGQQEQKSQAFTIARELLSVEVFARHGGLAAGLPNTLYVLTTTPDGRPVPCEVTLSPSVGPDLALRTGANGVGAVRLLPEGGGKAPVSVEVRASGPDGRRVTRTVALALRPEAVHLETEQALYRPGETVKVKVLTLAPAPVELRLWQEGRVLQSLPVAMVGNQGEATLALPPGLKGALELEAFTSPKSSVSLRLLVAQPGGLSVRVTADQPSHRPGATGALRFEVKTPAGKPTVAALGITVVDESLWALTASKPSQLRAFALLDQALLQPHGPLSAAALLAGEGFSQEDQLAAEALFSLTPAPQRAAGFSQDTSEAETAELSQRRDAWHAFAGAAFPWLLCALALVAVLAMLRFARTWLTALLVSVGLSLAGGALSAAFPQWSGQIFLGALALYVLAGMLHSQVRKAVTWSYLAVPALCVSLLVLFGDHVRRYFGKSAYALAGEPQTPVLAERPRRFSSFGATGVPGHTAEAADGAGPPARDDDGPPRREVRVREHFPETMFVQPELITDEAGLATLELPFADTITDWRLSALASSADGELGSTDTALRVFQDFFVDLEVPVALVKGDSATIPISVHNHLAKAQRVRLEVQPEDWFRVVGPATFALELDGNAVGASAVRIQVLRAGSHRLTLKADGTDLSDAVVRTVRVSEAGQQKTAVVSGTLKANATTTVALAIPKDTTSPSLMLKVYPSPLASALDGLEGSLQAPHGCFEQTSSTTYPNVLVWDFLKRTGKKSPALEEKARGFVALGYQRLLTFEVPGGGFEWFGRAPANQVLTAYGLMEFKDMARVFPVDGRLIQRTQDWLVSKQQPDGAWNPDQSSLSDGLWKSGFSSGRLMVSAYVTWSLVESGYQGPALAPALAFLAANLDGVKDPYTLAMVTATFGKANHASAGAAAKKLIGLVKRDEGRAWVAPSESTLYYSRGPGAEIETTALTAYALLVLRQEPELVRALLAFLAANRDGTGAWHSTQGTVLALRALLFAASSAGQDLELQVKVNGQSAGTLQLKASAEAPALVDLAASVRPGLNTVEVTGASDAQFQVVALFTQPWREAADAEELLSMKVDYGRTRVEVGGIVPVDVHLTYRGTEASGMVVVSVGVPAGLQALPEDLQALAASGAVARVELTADAVNLYLDRLTAKVPQHLSLRLKARSKVDTQGVGSAAWLYYHPALRAAVAATALKID